MMTGAGIVRIEGLVGAGREGEEDEEEEGGKVAVCLVPALRCYHCCITDWFLTFILAL